MEPATSIIKALGGASAVAQTVGVHRTRVWNWTRPRAKGGTGGLVPQSHHVALLAKANQLGVRLEAADFLPVPAPAQEVA